MKAGVYEQEVMELLKIRERLQELLKDKKVVRALLRDEKIKYDFLIVAGALKLDLGVDGLKEV